MMVPAYCPPCYPSPCQCGEDAPACSECGVPFPTVEAWEDAATCWACATDTCEDCIDAYGWPCGHFLADD